MSAGLLESTRFAPSPNEDDSDWKWPDTEGIQTYEGVLIHSARWPKDFDSTGKTIVVIGNGATGVQLLPEIQPGMLRCTLPCKDLLTTAPAAKKLYHVVRTPTWVLPPRIQSWKMTGQAEEAMSKIELDDRENFTQQTIDKFKSDPAYYRGFVKGTEKAVNKNFGIVSDRFPESAQDEVHETHPQNHGRL